jgi:hypothetical protein
MATENDFLVWAASATTNIDTQAAYAADPALGPGVSTGIASPLLYNKAQRQSSVFASAWAQFIVAQLNQPVIDDGTTATIMANLTAAINNIAAATITQINNNFTIPADGSGFYEIQGSSSYVITLPTPALFQGATQRFYLFNNTNAAQTISTPSGSFYGPGGSGNTSLILYPTQTMTLISDTANWICDKPQTSTKVGNVTLLTNQNWTVPAGVTSIKVTCTGGGASGSGCNNATYGGNYYSGAGGGAGGTAIGLYAVTPGQVIYATVGQAQPASNGAGNPSSFGSFCNASGGVAVNYFTASYICAGSQGGVGQGGAINLLGGYGSDGQNGQQFCTAGNGGSSYWGGGGRAGSAQGGGGLAGQAYGSGGGGAYAGTNGNGGAGAAGVIFIEYNPNQ